MYPLDYLKEKSWKRDLKIVWKHHMIFVLTVTAAPLAGPSRHHAGYHLSSNRSRLSVHATTSEATMQRHQYDRGNSEGAQWYTKETWKSTGERGSLSLWY